MIGSCPSATETVMGVSVSVGDVVSVDVPVSSAADFVFLGVCVGLGGRFVFVGAIVTSGFSGASVMCDSLAGRMMTHSLG